MSLERFHASPESWRDGRVALAGDESHHCLRVMRKRVGEEVEVFDGAGRFGRGVIAGEVEGVVQVELQTDLRAAMRLPRITLAAGIPKGKTMELVVQKAVELGVSAIQPLVTERTVVRLEGAEAAKKAGKWQRVALEACKQCGQNWLPQVERPVGLSSWLAGRDRARGGLIGSLTESAIPLRDGIRGLPGGLADLDLLIGPEGDFTAAESADALAAGFVPVTMGEITLRVETAVLFALSVLNYELRLG